jgi:hypothetical protein
VTESLRIRKEKMLARKRDRRLLEQGKLRVEQVCLACAVRMDREGPLIFDKVHLEEEWEEEFAEQ